MTVSVLSDPNMSLSFVIIADEEESRNDSLGSVLVGDSSSEPAKLVSDVE